MRNRRRPGEGGDGGQLAAEILQQPAPDARRQQREAAERRAGDVRERVVLVRVAAEAAGEPRRVQHERRPDHGHAAGQRPLERDAELPAARGRGLEQRVGGRGAQRLRPAGSEQRTGAAVEHRLGGGDAEDEIGLEQERVDAQWCPSRVADVDEVGRLGVVHRDPTVEVARERRWSSASSSRWPARRLSPPATRIVWRVVGTPSRSSSLDRGRECVAARIAGRSGQRQLRRLDDERRGAAARDERLERRAGEGEAERVADGRGDVDDAFGGAARPQHDAVADVHDRDPRAGRDRNPRHYGMWRYSRRNVSRKPRCGQKRDESRLVTRQSVTMTVVAPLPWPTRTRPR